MNRFVDKIVIPYVKNQRKELDLPSTFPALAVFDLIAAHRCSSVLEKLRDNNIHVHQKFVPGGCTGDLQPLDIKINALFKKEVKAKFTNWYSEHVTAGLQQGKEVGDINVDLRLSHIKPMHAKWMISVVSSLSAKSELIKEAFQAAGIV